MKIDSSILLAEEVISMLELRAIKIAAITQKNKMTDCFIKNFN